MTQLADSRNRSNSRRTCCGAAKGEKVPTDILPSVPQELRLLGGSSGVDWFEIAFIKGLSQRTGHAVIFG
jgi:hypothetical protein